MKTLKPQQSNESVATYVAKPASANRFVQKHFGPDNRPNMAPGFEGDKDRVGNNVDQLYRGGVVKPADRPGKGYAPAPSDEDEKVYEGKTWRHGDNTKHKKGAVVKKFLQKKRQDAERRLSEEIEIPEGEEVVELAEKTQPDVRALRGEIIHKTFVGMVGTAAEQNHYVVQDGGGRKYHIFTNKALGEKKDPVDLNVHEYKKGSGILSVAKANVVKEEVELNEARRGPGSVNDPHHPQSKTAHEVYLEHHAHVKNVLKDISGGLDAHKARVTKPVLYPSSVGGVAVMKKNPGKANWLDVGDMTRVRSDVEHVRDYLFGRGEYATAAPVGTNNAKIHREEIEVNENDSTLNLPDVRTKMMAANKVHQLGVKFGDKGMQEAAKKRLQQLAQRHSELVKQDVADEVDPEFDDLLSQINELLTPSLAETFVEAVGEELAEVILSAYQNLDDEGKEMLLELVRNEQWEAIIEIFTSDLTETNTRNKKKIVKGVTVARPPKSGSRG